MEPFLKWAGGKRWLASRSLNLFPSISDINNYYEPFLGSGAIFFHLEPKMGCLSDINSDLINSYKVIRDDWANLLDVLERYHRSHCVDFYYDIRAMKPRTKLHQAARFIYLNRTCWNGLYRVNKKGMFNVPIGTKSKVILDTDDFETMSFVLSKIDLESCDFEVTINKAKEGDFLFIDPPYTVKHNLNGFVKYNENIFSWNDQVRLSQCVKRAIDRGASVVVLNADHISIRELYRGVGKRIRLERSSVIAGNSNYRGVYSEIVIKCLK